MKGICFSEIQQIRRRINFNRDFKKKEMEKKIVQSLITISIYIVLNEIEYM